MLPAYSQSFPHRVLCLLPCPPSGHWPNVRASVKAPDYLAYFKIAPFLTRVSLCPFQLYLHSIHHLLIYYTTYLFLFKIFLPHPRPLYYNVWLKRAEILFSFVIPSTQKSYLAHSRSSIKICWMIKKKTLSFNNVIPCSPDYRIITLNFYTMQV